ncbi:RNA polymerase subunit sigma-70 [Pedobacter sp. HMWF019]|uniref:RNA polymerase sigma factor n=1 Tax=Pedobacter sp. HMWF019 TaxID=2056856 RepID=UPI000D33F908|nr:RNA polymerase sigma-70 factor [Pedobacter sp. HMWF019]PTT02457.1 RNA polymerase subunit sigma-70 [Pedobacter sp. HMWF019]
MVSYAALQDNQLISLLKEGDSASFTEIYNRYKGELYVYACKIVKDEELAADLVQEILISLWDRRETLVFKSSIVAYLFTALRYKFFDWIDKQKVRTDYAESFQLFIDEGDWVTDNQIAEKELMAFVEEQINKLPEKMKAVFLMSYKENLSYQEIGLRLNISEKTAHNQANNALRLLKSKIGAFALLLFLHHL